MTTKNILFFVSDLERGGLELRLLNFARHFPENYTIHICVMSDNFSLKDDFESLNAKIIIVPIKKIYFSFDKLLQLSNYTRLNKIKIVNSFDLKGFLISIFIKLLNFGHPKIIFNNVGSLTRNTSKQRRLLLPLLRFSDAVICNSRFSKNQIETHISHARIYVVHNGVDTVLFEKNVASENILKAEFGINDHQVVLGTIGNFRGEKNYPFLLRSFEILSSRHRELKLLCVGGGEGIREMKSMLKRNGLDQKVFLTGYTEKVKEYLSIMDIFVLVSLYEGLPNAILEAMSMKLPIASSSVGGCSELIEHLKNGILFPANDMEKFIQAVEKLIDHNNLAQKLAANARRTVEERFSLNRMINNYLFLYEKLSMQKQ